MNIRPHDLPELRADLAEQLSQPQVIRRMWPDGYAPNRQQQQFEAELVARTRTAEMFHVAEEMTNLAAGASKTLERFALEPEDVPSINGLMIFDGNAPFEAEYDDGCRNELRGIAWYVQKHQVFAIPAVLPHGALGKGSRVALDPEGSFLAELGGESRLMAPSGGGAGAFDVFGMLITLSLLMGQSLASDEQIEPDRAARKRLRRRNAEPGPVRVITLRRPRSNTSDEGGGREYHHQWIARGHWRQQWHPKRQVHRPVWIAPHVKGPEGAPLIGGEKVYSLKR